MNIAGRSDVGLVRKNNQDNYLISKNKQGDILAIVCDGIGGSKAGEVASLIATKMIGESFSHYDGFESIDDGEAWLKEILTKTNDSIFTDATTNNEHQGMGTTFVGALIVKGKLIVANVGDSRAYVLEDNQLSQVSEDHSLVNELVLAGKIKVEQLESHPQRNILTNALGIVGKLRLDIFKVNQGDQLLLCSDGLSGYVDHSDIEEVLSNNMYSINKKLESLVNMANNAGGYDNVTVVIAKLGGLLDEAR